MAIPQADGDSRLPRYRWAWNSEQNVTLLEFEHDEPCILEIEYGSKDGRIGGHKISAVGVRVRIISDVR